MSSSVCSLALAATIFLFILLAAGSSKSFAAPDGRKAAFRALYLFNFIKFTTWPDAKFAEDTSPIVVGVFGEDVAFHLQRIVAGESVRGRTIVVRRLEPRTGAEDDGLGDVAATLRSCHMVYVDMGTHSSLALPVLRRVSGANVVTVSDSDQFCRNGGMLGLVWKDRDNRYGIDANVGEIEKTALRISSKLLALARIVETASN